MSELIEIDTHKKERAFVIGVLLKGMDKQWLTDTLTEMSQLADTAGAVVIDTVIQERKSPDRTTFIGKGFAEELAKRIEEEKIDVVLFDDDLTPAQTRNLEKILQTKVVDRTGLILDIFALRAKTREAEVQVELAQLEYQLPRLTGRWKHLERQRGGIDMRGPGETQLESDRRLVRERIAQLKKILEGIEQSRHTQRSRREKLFRIAIIGYTNAGKSTLFRALTGGNPFIEDRLFATLDSLVRPLRLPNSTEPALLVDTVGFIRKLPHSLVASFKSTLEETVDADLLIHVVDLSNPAYETQMKDVQVVLEEIKAHQVPTLLIFNKIDKLVQSEDLTLAQQRFPESILVSAERGHRIWELKNRIAEQRSSQWTGYEVKLSVEGAGKGLAAIYEHGEVIRQEVEEDGTTKVWYKVPIQYYRKLEEILHPLKWKAPLPKRKNTFALREYDRSEHRRSHTRRPYPSDSTERSPRSQNRDSTTKGKEFSHRKPWSNEDSSTPRRRDHTDRPYRDKDNRDTSFSNRNQSNDTRRDETGDRSFNRKELYDSEGHRRRGPRNEFDRSRPSRSNPSQSRDRYQRSDRSNESPSRNRFHDRGNQPRQPQAGDARNDRRGSYQDRNRSERGERSYEPRRSNFQRGDRVDRSSSSFDRPRKPADNRNRPNSSRPYSARQDSNSPRPSNRSGSRPYSARQDSNSPRPSNRSGGRPYSARQDSDSPRPSNRSGGRPYSARQDSNSPRPSNRSGGRPYSARQDSDSPRPSNRSGSRPYSARQDSNSPRPSNRSGGRPYSARQDSDSPRPSNRSGGRPYSARQQDSSNPRSSSRSEGRPYNKRSSSQSSASSNRRSDSRSQGSQQRKPKKDS